MDRTLCLNSAPRFLTRLNVIILFFELNIAYIFSGMRFVSLCGLWVCTVSKTYLREKRWRAIMCFYKVRGGGGRTRPDRQRQTISRTRAVGASLSWLYYFYSIIGLISLYNQTRFTLSKNQKNCVTIYPAGMVDDAYRLLRRKTTNGAKLKSANENRLIFLIIIFGIVSEFSGDDAWQSRAVLLLSTIPSVFTTTIKNLILMSFKTHRHGYPKSARVNTKSKSGDLPA